MKIGSLYNTKITLDDEDLISFDEKHYLWIRDEGDTDKLYRSIKPIVGILRRDLTVNSAGYYSRDEKFHKDWKWMSYRENNTNFKNN